MSIARLTVRGGQCVLAALVILAGACMGPADGQDSGEQYEVRAPGQPAVLIYRPEAPAAPPADEEPLTSDEEPLTAWRSEADHNEGPQLPASIRVFYPTGGQSSSGQCWGDMVIDSADNLYPSHGGGVYRLLPDGTLVNGVDDENLFATGVIGSLVLDESRGRFFSVIPSALLEAPFAEGSSFSPLLTESGPHFLDLALGRGPLADSLLVAVAGPPPRIERVTLSPLQRSGFSQSELLGDFLFGQASAPDGTLYVVSGVATSRRPRLIRIGTDGTASVFAEGTDIQFNSAVVVDDEGNVYWSRADGMVKYDASGRLLGRLPGPPDKVIFGGPSAAVFDSHGDLFLVDNAGCKQIYKYTLGAQEQLRVAIDIRPGHEENTFDPSSHGTLEVAILSSDTFDATQVDPRTIRFGATGTEAKRKRCWRRDVNGDGRRDKVLEVKIQRTGLSCTSTSAVLTGRTKQGVLFQGSDAVIPTGCGR